MPRPPHVIVVIDDDRRVRESLQSVLESAGYEALLFASAEECLASDALAQAACAIADVRLPGIDGLELQRRLRQRRLSVPVIVITAHDDEDTRLEALRGGALAFM